MANLQKKIAKIDVVIGGIEAANNALDGMKKRSKELKQEMMSLADEMEKSMGDPAKYDAAKKSFTDIEKQVKSLDKAIKDTKNAIFPIEELMQNLSGQTVRTLNTMRKSLGNSLLGLNPNKNKDLSAFQKLQEQIRMVTDEIARRKGTIVDFKDIMGQIGTTSDKSLSMAKQRLQELISTTGKSSQELELYRQQLKQVTDEENRRATEGAAATIAKVNQGNFTGTIAEAKEAIKLIEQYKQGLQTSDASGIKNADDAIEILNTSLKKTTESIMTYDEAMMAAQKVGQGTFTGTYEDLDKVRKALEQYKRQLSVTDTKKLEAVNIALRNVNKATEQAKSSMIDVDKVINRIKSAPLEDLERAAKQLQMQLNEAHRGTREFITTASKLRSVQSEIKKTSRLWEEHENVIIRTAKRLTSYVLVYAGFNQALSLLKQMTRANLELSDSLADIQKTTGLTTKQVSELSRAIDSIDTRTSQKELHDLAYQAGKLGISAQEDVYSFVKAGNQLLVALGEDLGGTDAIKNLMKINAVLGETQTLGVERALMATGSAINEVGQNSTANEGYLVDFAQRLSGIAAQSGITMAQLIGLGGTADALGQNVEVSATALNKFIISLQTNTRAVAQAAGMSEESLAKMLKSGETMRAIVEVFEGLSKRGGIAELAPIMGDLGSDGARMVQVLAAIASNTTMLRSQLYIATEGFKEATSVTNEYNIKNENAMAILTRMGNTIQEKFVNSTFVGWLKDVLYNISLIPSWVERNYTSFRILVSVLSGMVTQLILARIGVVDFLKSLTVESIKKFIVNTISLGRAFFTTATSAQGARKAIDALKLAFSANWLGLLLNVLATVVTYFIAFRDRVEEGVKAMTDFNTQVVKESTSLNNLRAAIERANEGTGERASLIQRLNDRYGKYLGFVITESNYIDKQKYIYDKLNASIRETLALKMQEKLTENVVEKYTGPLQKAIDKIRNTLEEIPDIGAESADDAIYLITSTMEKAITEGTDATQAAIKALNDKGFDVQWDIRAYKSLLFYISSLEKVQKNIQKEIGTTSKALQGQADAAKAVSKELNLSELRKMNSGILQSEDITELQTYVSIAGEFIKTLDKTGKMYQMYADNIAKAKTKIDKLSTSGDTIWGVGATIQTASVSKLAATYKDMEDRIKSLNVDADNYADTVKKYEKIREDARKELANRGRNEKGTLLKGSTGDSTANKDLTDQRKAIKARLADFEAIYKDFQRQMTEQYNQGNLTETSFNNQMLANDLAYYQDRQDVLQDFLDGRTRIISRAGKDISKITDETLRSELSKNISEEAAKSEQALKKMADSIDKSMLHVMDKITKARQEWADKLEKSGSLGIVGDQGISRTEQDSRLKAIESFYSQLDKLTNEGLRRQLSSEQLYGEEAQRLTEAQLEQLREQYQNYYDTINKLALAEADKEWKRPGGRKEQYNNAERVQEQNVKMQSSFKIIGLGTDSMEEDSELVLLRLKMQAAKEYYDLVQSKGAESLAAREELAEAQAALDEKELEITQRKLETMKQYTDAVVTFGEQMGEAASGEVSDRKEAAKQLLQTTMKLTKDLMMQEIQRMIFKKSIKGQEVALEQATSQSILQTEGSTMIGSMTATGVKTQADVVAGTASGASKTIAELGWWGIPLIAVISAALSALLGTVMGGLSKSKSEVAAATGATTGKRMATGMLTYAEGDYPVLGNDGQMYNATYQKELKTGVYSGGAHFGIFSEKKPEMIVDGDTTRKLIVDYPHIYDAITTIAQHGRLKNAMPTFASGDYPAGINNIAGIEANAENEEASMSIYMQQMQDTLTQSNEVNKQLLTAIRKGIVANINPYTNYEAQKKANKFIQKRGID